MFENYKKEYGEGGRVVSTRMEISRFQGLNERFQKFSFSWGAKYQKLSSNCGVLQNSAAHIRCSHFWLPKWASTTKMGFWGLQAEEDTCER